MNYVHIHIPSIPPSTNHAYNTFKGRRVLSAAGKAYKKETTNHIVRRHPQALKLFEKNKPYLVAIHLTFGTSTVLLNKGYPEKTDSRYKKLDVSNRIKLLEDALTDATGIDDCHHWTVVVRKAIGRADATHIWAWSLEDDGTNPFTNALDTLLSIAEDE